jgi:hypothetical protein
MGHPSQSGMPAVMGNGPVSQRMGHPSQSGMPAVTGNGPVSQRMGHPSQSGMPAVSPQSVRALPPSNPGGPPSSGGPISSPSPSMRAGPASGVPSSMRPRVEDRERVFVERAQSILNENMFKRLSVGRDASDEQIERAFATVSSMWDVSTVHNPSESGIAAAVAIADALREARASLLDPMRRKDEERAAFFGLQKQDPAEDLAKSGELTEVNGARACLLRGDLDRAERMARRATKANQNDATAMALLAWIEAQRPSNQDEAATKTRIAMLDRAISYNGQCDEAYYYRAKLYARINNPMACLRDLRRVAQLNPKHQEAVRELRIYEMRARNGTLDDGRKNSGLFNMFKK